MEHRIILSLPNKKKLLGCLCVLAFIFGLVRFIPNPTLKAFEKRQYSTCFYDANDVLLYVMPLEEGLRREYICVKNIPSHTKDAFIQAEDKSFYKHFGINITSIARAFFQNKKEGRIVSGASTITMQLARIIWQRKNGVNFFVKIKEAFLSLYLEYVLSKDEILELYLNSVPFGKQVEGVASAARSFFGCTVAELTPEQSLRLSTIIKRPTDNALEKTFTYPHLCPHFVNYIIADYKKKNSVIPPELHLSIDSTLTAEAQKRVLKKLDDYKDSRIHNGAVLAINNKTGQIVVWSGNSSFDDDAHSGQIDGVLTKNQPGSSMKPFLYALAIEKGVSPGSVLPDIPMDFGGSGVYVPLNFNNKYNGPVLFRVSLASSLNIPAVYLLNKIGIKNYMERLSALGFYSLDGTEDVTGLSLALGSSEVSLLEMVRAFSVFTNDGKLVSLTYKRESEKEKSTRVYNSDTARIICDILTDENARKMGFGNAKVFDTPYPSIFKTGTSNQFQNIIALGSTTQWTVGVWMGNMEGETVIGQTGSSIPATVVRSLLDELEKRSPGSAFLPCEYYKKIKICSVSGMLATENCISVSEEYTEDKALLNNCDWHYTHNGRVKIRYPSEYQHWADSRNFLGDSSLGSVRGRTPLAITHPRNNAHYVYDHSLPPSVQILSVRAVGGEDKYARLFFDDTDMGTAENIFSWNIPLAIGAHKLKVVCGSESTETYFIVN